MLCPGPRVCRALCVAGRLKPSSFQHKPCCLNLDCRVRKLPPAVALVPVEMPSAAGGVTARCRAAGGAAVPAGRVRHKPLKVSGMLWSVLGFLQMFSFKIQLPWLRSMISYNSSCCVSLQKPHIASITERLLRALPRQQNWTRREGGATPSRCPKARVAQEVASAGASSRGLTSRPSWGAERKHRASGIKQAAHYAVTSFYQKRKKKKSKIELAVSKPACSF